GAYPRFLPSQRHMAPSPRRKVNLFPQDDESGSRASDVSLRTLRIRRSQSPILCPSVQLRLRLRLVPVRPRRDVLELRLEEIVQELLLRVLHLREDLARGGRANAIHGVRVDGPL